uniref:Ankyrin repeat and SOCS box containing 2a, tandem duplicate 1 n=1 Tax=Eptatretus burgeri TaxID=7764 RepID=A0A8C4NJM1_EPTBU
MAIVLCSEFPGLVDRRTLQAETPLMVATERGDLDSMELLLEAGANPDISGANRETPLYRACEMGRESAVALLLDGGADPNHRCQRGWTALHEAAARNFASIVRLLLTAGARLESRNAYGLTPFFVAAQCGKPDTLCVLYSAVDIDTQANDGATALYEACKNEHVETVAVLLRIGADTNKVTKDMLLPLHISAAKGNIRLLQLLLLLTSRSCVRKSGISPVYLAAENGHAEALRLLDRAERYEDGRATALFAAVYGGYMDCVDILLSAGADPNLDPVSPLLVAVKVGTVHLVKTLIEAGADLTASLPNNPCPFLVVLRLALQRLDILKVLLDSGCEATACFQCKFGSGPHPIRPSTAFCSRLRLGLSFGFQPWEGNRPLQVLLGYPRR